MPADVGLAVGVVEERRNEGGDGEGGKRLGGLMRCRSRGRVSS